MYFAPRSTHPVLSQDYSDTLTPGVQVVVDPTDAEALGLCVETAISEADAWEANADLSGAQAEHV